MLVPVEPVQCMLTEDEVLTANNVLLPEQAVFPSHRMDECEVDEVGPFTSISVQAEVAMHSTYRFLAF